MAVQYHIAGPVTIEYGATGSYENLGRTDGNVRVSIASLEPSIPVEDDSAGGMAVDEVQQDSVILVRMVLQARDTAVLNKVRARLKSGGTLAEIGESQRPGFLRRGDGVENRELKITGAKLSAANGLGSILIHDAIMDAETDAEISEIGSIASRMTLAIRGYSKLVSGTWRTHTLSAVT